MIKYFFKLAAGLMMLLVLPVTLFCQNNLSDYSTLTYSVSPRYDLPLSDSILQYKYGLGGQVSIDYKPPVKFPFYLTFDAGYMYSPFQIEWATPLHTVFTGAGLGLNYNFLGRMMADIYVKGGYYGGFLTALSNDVVFGGNPFVEVGGGMGFYFTPSFSIRAGASYRQLLGNPEALFQSVGFYLGASYRIPLKGSFDIGPSTKTPFRLKISNIKYEDIFPVFYKYYDDHPIGKAVIKNDENGEIENVKVSLFIKQYMDNPKSYVIEQPFKKGEQRGVDLFALFNENVLGITEGAKVSSQITISYDFKGDEKSGTVTNTVMLLNRNASIWDDDRRAAAFITARDPLVLKFSKNLMSIIREEPENALGNNFMFLDAVHNTLSLYGMTYAVDPKTPYKKLHEEKNAVDFLQFPRQTLDYKAGDCDDLSILYASLLEAVNIETALITVPGHIYIAVYLGMNQEDADSIFFNRDDLILRDNKVWLPFEVTMQKSSFLQAWQKGSAEWLKYNLLGKAGFYTVPDAWKVFEPVGLPGEPADINLPDSDVIRKAVDSDMKKASEREISGKVKNLKERIKQSGNNAKLLNKLGVIYARYNLYEKAEEQFLKIPDTSGYRGIALANIGNIRFRLGEYKESLRYYKDAERILKDNSILQLNITRAEYELGNFDIADKHYNQLKIVSPELAERYSYLGSGGKDVARASSAEEKGDVLWQE